jgi:hypothetical protein
VLVNKEENYEDGVDADEASYCVLAYKDKALGDCVRFDEIFEQTVCEEKGA